MTLQQRLENLQRRSDVVSKFNPCHSKSDGTFCATGESKGGGGSESLESKAKRMAAEHASRQGQAKFPGPSSTDDNFSAPRYLKNWWSQSQGKESGGKTEAKALAAKLEDKQLKRVLGDLNHYKHTKDPFIRNLFDAVGSEVNRRGGVK